jgi:hypothetical protein
MNIDELGNSEDYRDRMKLQYHSKFYKKWVDFKATDSYEGLKKYEYKFRVNPKYKGA